jgi:hypothetical protein
VRPGLAITDAAQGGQVGVQVATCAQRAYFIEKARRQHRIEALFDTCVQLWAIGGQ